MKLDIWGFFMSIPRAALWARLRQFIGEQYREPDVDLVLQVTRDIALTDATRACQIAGQRSDWRGLPPDKSLFTTAPGCGLPIGNLTSQVFANFYLHPLDTFITQTLGITRYGRYVDDFYLGLTRQFRSHRLRRRVLRRALRPGLAAELISPRALQWVRLRGTQYSKGISIYSQANWKAGSSILR